MTHLEGSKGRDAIACIPAVSHVECSKGSVAVTPSHLQRIIELTLCYVPPGEPDYNSCRVACSDGKAMVPFACATRQWSWAHVVTRAAQLCPSLSESSELLTCTPALLVVIRRGWFSGRFHH